MILGGSIEVAPSYIRDLKPSNIAPISWSQFVDVKHPTVPIHNSLFDAKFVAPLAHINSENDANGKPDVPESDYPVPTNFNRKSIHQSSAQAHDSSLVENHLHERFMSDLLILK